MTFATSDLRKHLEDLELCYMYDDNRLFSSVIFFHCKFVFPEGLLLN